MAVAAAKASERDHPKAEPIKAEAFKNERRCRKFFICTQGLCEQINHTHQSEQKPKSTQGQIFCRVSSHKNYGSSLNLSVRGCSNECKSIQKPLKPFTTMKTTLFLAAFAFFCVSVVTQAQTKRLKADRAEDRRDKREDVRDRHENRHDRREDVRDRQEDIRDAKEDLRDARHNGGIRDKREDIRDAREDVRDAQEDVRDRREDGRDRRENRRDRREDKRDRRRGTF
jgi:hypothetical protein